MGSKAGSSAAIPPELPIADAAAKVITASLSPLPRLIARASGASASTGDQSSIRAVHQLRVAVRRAEAALHGFADVLPKRRCRRTLKRLRRVRRAAGRARDLDVLIELLAAETRTRDRSAARAARDLKERAESARHAAQALLARLDADHPKRKWSRILRKLTASIDPARVGESIVRKLARRVVRQAADEVTAAGRADLGQINHLHALRLKLKRLRYTIELFAGCADPSTIKPILTEMAALQTALGAAGDSHRLCAECRDVIRESADPGAFQTLLRTLEPRAARDLESAMQAWAGVAASGLFSKLERAFADSHRASPASPIPVSVTEPKPLASPVHAESLNGHGDPSSRHGRSRQAKRRLAAIDVGTNSTRLIIAEASSGGYRVLDDEKEITRLGRGVDSNRVLAPDAIAYTAATVARMCEIARGYSVDLIKVVATAAARDAANGAELVDAIRRSSGLDVEIISAEQEAMLAYRSAANAFDLRSRPAVVIDLGGGSTEIVLSVGRESCPGEAIGPGVVERIYTIPLGAVRLTERFGGPEACAGERFRDMRRHVRTVIRQHLGKRGLPVLPQLSIGTGGTFTTLAAMARAHAAAESGLHGAQARLAHTTAGLFEGSVQGAAIGRAEVRHLLEFIRKLSPRDRVRVPGLPADRADIIVAGLCVIDVLLKELDCNTVRAHEGGIRDGLLLAMLDGFGIQADALQGASGPGLRADPMKAVRKFARACGYEQAHSLHVSKLSLQLFDQLGPALQPDFASHGLDPSRARQLLEAAAILHDIGYLINYTAHHKHAYHLIVHADLPGWTPDETQIIANIARYHRSAEPKRKHRHFAALDPRARRLVRILAGILRIADGLDRSHMQQVQGLRVLLTARDMFLSVHAAGPAEVDLWGAARKSGLLESVLGRTPHFERESLPQGVIDVPATADRSSAKPVALSA
ncbi:MAG: CHAD domain-containing protein [Phycisphaerales bacterium]